MSGCGCYYSDGDLKRVVIGAEIVVFLSSVNSSMERSLCSYTSEARSRVFCLCNVEAPLLISWTEENPGRRFNGCGLYKWHNPIGNNRQKKIIVALMKEVDELMLREKDLQSRMSDMMMKEKFIWIVLLGGGEADPFQGQGICSLCILGKAFQPSIGELVLLP
ncbi:hypothetical protein HKD37_06G016737 [Glycine soja]